MPSNGLVSGETAGGAEQHGRMSVVPAGVHKPRRNGRMIGAARLFNRQGVHVGAKERALLAGVAPARSRHAGRRGRRSSATPSMTSSNPKALSRSATMREVRGRSYNSSGFRWRSRRHSVSSGVMAAIELLRAMVMAALRTRTAAAPPDLPAPESQPHSAVSTGVRSGAEGCVRKAARRSSADQNAPRVGVAVTRRLGSE